MSARARRLVDMWKGFCDSLGTQGGNLALLTAILLGFTPMLWNNNAEAWKAATFLLGAIAGLINTSHNQTTVIHPPNTNVAQITTVSPTGMVKTEAMPVSAAPRTAMHAETAPVMESFTWGNQ